MRKIYCRGGKYTASPDCPGAGADQTGGMSKETNRREPLEGRAVDLFIVGGTAAGVALALAAARAGASVMLCTPRPYLGEDICGDLLLWPEAGESPVTPMQVKLGLEQALVEAAVPFLLTAAPARPLRVSDGRIGGWELATRSGYVRVRARLVVDATSEGTLGRIAGALREPWAVGKREVWHTTLCQGDGADASGERIVERPASLTGRIGDRAYRLSARTYRLEVDFGAGGWRDLARVEAEVVSRCWVPGEYAHQERLRLAPEAGVAPQDPVATDIPFYEGLCQFSPAAFPDPGMAAALRDPSRSREVADGLGGWLVSRAMRLELPAEADLLPLPEPAVWDRCDVLVLGGGTGGAPAAIAAARQGADTVVVEVADQLGGVGTIGQIARYWCGNRVGFTSEIDRGVAELETDPRLRQNVGQWTISAKSRWYEETCRGAGVTVLFRSLCAGVESAHGRVTGLHIASPYGFGLIRAGCVVDATGAADVAAGAGAATTGIGAGHVAVQGTGLAGRDPAVDYHNTDHNFCDDTDVLDTTAFLVSSKLKYRDHFDAGQLVDSRERRQIIGEICLGPSDFLSERRYPDTICVASSNFDTHGFTLHPVFMCRPPDKKRLWADVPFRALLPQGLERVLVTGLGVSAHRDAIPVIRMQADVQNQGYAAGCAAAQAALTDTDLRALPMRALQRHLHATGILPERVLSDEDSFPLPDAALAEAVAQGADSLKDLAMLFAEPERARPLLRQALAAVPDPERQTRFALVLALMGDEAGRQLVQSAVQARPWDEGWNFRGMGQFGRSLSELDAFLIALGRVGRADAWPVLLDKAASLPENPAFSHCRALAEAAEALYPRFPHPDAAPALAALLRRPALAGHAQTSLVAVQAALSDDPCDTVPRNNALRELHLARALYRCGDLEDLGRGILLSYAADCRAAFSRHAMAILAAKA